MKKFYASLLLCSTINFVTAQWASDPKQNTFVADVNASDIQTANTNDGRTWIAFYSQNGDNYDMRAQLLNEKGHRVFGSDGILVSKKKSGSATFVFNVCVDHDNNLIIAFQHQGFDYECIAQKVSTTGELVWGTGVDLGKGLAPYPVALSTNEIAIAWINNSTINYQKISADGVPAWADYKRFHGSASHNVTRPQLVAGTNGKFSMIYQDLVFFPFYTYLYAEKFDNDGNKRWQKPVQISTLVTAGYRYFDVMSDADTTYVGYYGNPQSSNRFDAYVQRINADGSLPYGTNGSAIANYSGNNQPYEQTIFIAKAKEVSDIWAVCTVTNSLQTASTVYAQKFNALTGAKLLGNNGKALSSLSSNLTSLAFSKLSLCDNEPLFLVTDVNNKLAAVKLTTDGSFAWADSFKVVGKTRNTKFRYGFTDVYNGQAVAVWQEDKGSGDMPYAQNIQCDGSTGFASTQLITKNNTISIQILIKNLYPNPVQNVLNATIISSKQNDVHIYVTDVSGNVMKQFQKEINAGNNSVQLNVSNLKAGNYFIKVMGENISAAAMFNK